MATQEYITISDITNPMFSRLSVSATQQVYIDIANDECENLAQQLGIEPEEIITPIHFGIKQYLECVVLAKFGADYIGANQAEVSDADIYKNLFDRSRYLMNQYKPDITYEMFTDSVNDRSDRAVSFGQLYRG